MSEELAADPYRAGEVVLYATDDGEAQVFVRAMGSTGRLSQAELSALEKFNRQLVRSGETDAA